MSITLITGVPGSGKTLYCVSNLLRPLIGSTLAVEDDDGVTTVHPRTIFSNINGLQLDHELIDGNGEWKRVAGVSGFEGEHEQGLHHWQEWARPGSVVVYDEFQKCWPPRPNGAAVPPDVQALDTHRHMGVDFILMTQNCLNVDRHILGLVDRHLHVRRVANLNMAVVYEWDHASRSLLYKNAMAKSPWRYDKSVFKLYKSAKAHTKQKRKMPSLVWFVLAGAAGFAYLGPSTFQRIGDRMTGKTGQSVAAVKSTTVEPKIGEKTEYVKDGIKYTVEKTVNTSPPPVITSASPTVKDVAQLVDLPVIAGCASVRDKCACVDSKGEPVPTEPEICQSKILGNSLPGQKVLDLAPFLSSYDAPSPPATAHDLSVVSFMAQSKRKPLY